MAKAVGSQRRQSLHHQGRVQSRQSMHDDPLICSSLESSVELDCRIQAVSWNEQV